MPLVPYLKSITEAYPPNIYEGQLLNIVCGEELAVPYEVQGENTKLITDLSDTEKNAMNEVFSKLEVE